MKTGRWYVVNKETLKSVFSSFRPWECEEYLAKLEDKENYGIGFKMISI